MVEPLRHRQTKEAATDMFDLQLPRHISTLPLATLGLAMAAGRFRRKAEMALSSLPCAASRHEIEQALAPS